ncbi:NAD(P)H-dependent oxidoreductase [Cyclobacterium amurskyense]|mgnify:FL=1|uniref:glutathione-regulated potassium-efflux system oxidoreductase KefF n=1 Tax=Cyclobacterium amurskyense TaxID=320787 RepID=UPI0030D8D935|tara:strand:+ start:3816 stop:4400 length:585 start_codon:yes stop_codon:yes gene_type:complete
MKNILVLMAHPKLEHSKVIARLMASINGLENVEITDLYERYPDFNIDVQHEQEMLISADIVILMHPLYWYSAPPLMKQWIDLVLEYNWAYGHKGIYLKGKYLFNAISTGGSIDAYSTKGHHGFPIKEFLLPFKQTARLCNMVYLPPFHIAGTHNITSKKLQQEINDFKALILHLRDNPNYYKLEQLPFLNDFKQ